MIRSFVSGPSEFVGRAEQPEPPLVAAKLACWLQAVALEVLNRTVR
jgi:hypothetical protein